MTNGLAHGHASVVPRSRSPRQATTRRGHDAAPRQLGHDRAHGRRSRSRPRPRCSQRLTAHARERWPQLSRDHSALPRPGSPTSTAPGRRRHPAAVPAALRRIGPQTGASRSTGPATTTTRTRSCPPATRRHTAKTPSTPPAASTSTTPPPGPQPPTNLTGATTSPWRAVALERLGVAEALQGQFANARDAHWAVQQGRPQRRRCRRVRARRRICVARPCWSCHARIDSATTSCGPPRATPSSGTRSRPSGSAVGRVAELAHDQPTARPGHSEQSRYGRQPGTRAR